MGNGNIIGNLGITVLLVTLLFILFIVVVFASAYFANKYALSEKVRELFDDLKSILLYNPLIRYTMLNCLKLNNTGMVAFIGLSTGIVQFSLSVLIVTVMTTLPIIYAVIVYKKRKELNKAETKEKFHSLYLGLEQKDSKNIKVGNSYYAIWLYPLLWMLRRSIFMAITIFLFEYPIIQFAANYILSIAYITFLVH